MGPRVMYERCDAAAGQLASILRTTVSAECSAHGCSNTLLMWALRAQVHGDEDFESAAERYAGRITCY